MDRFHPQQRKELQTVIEAGQLLKTEDFEILSEQQMRPLAIFSAQLLGLGALFFIVLNLVSYTAQTHQLFPSITFWGFVVWFLLNIVGYVVILPMHELIHGIAFAFWGGRPHFGAKLPFALYCGAKGQLFHRNAYLVVGLAPVVVLTLVGILFMLLNPIYASYSLLAVVGNVSGAAGDLWVAERLRHVPANVLVEDTETGYRVWETRKV